MQGIIEIVSSEEKEKMSKAILAKEAKIGIYTISLWYNCGGQIFDRYKSTRVTPSYFLTVDSADGSGIYFATPEDLETTYLPEACEEFKKVVDAFAL